MYFLVITSICEILFICVASDNFLVFSIFQDLRFIPRDFRVYIRFGGFVYIRFGGFVCIRLGDFVYIRLGDFVYIRLGGFVYIRLGGFV
jgi:hypothetical protein